MKYSIFLNSRKRTQYLYRLLNSIKHTTANLDEIECFVSCDDDDEFTLGFIDNLLPNWPFCKFEFIKRDRNLHRRLNNLLLKLSGEYIWILNDDCEIITENWDLESSKILPNGYNNIIYGHTTCNSVDKERSINYSSFPMLSRNSVDILGHFITPKIPALGGDVYLWRIFSEINRITYLPINVKHSLHETISAVINCDQVASEMRQFTMSNNTNGLCWNIDISEEIQKLNESINSI